VLDLTERKRAQFVPKSCTRPKCVSSAVIMAVRLMCLAGTSDATLYAGVRLWQGAELQINPEIDQGFGLANTLGVAGFTSGEAYKVGNGYPYARPPRAFVRRTRPSRLNLGMATGCPLSHSNLEVTSGL
jgi:hypothetical protein